jgi:23S rRNA (cytosine1962-C5)-methyltransferase
MNGNEARSLRDILSSAWNRRRDYVMGNELEAFRLVTKEEMGWAGGYGLPVAVDIYGYRSPAAETGDAAVIQIYDADVLGSGEGAELEDLKDWLKSEFGVTRFFYKRRFRVKETPDAGGELAEEPVEMVIQENGLKFLINLNNYLDTGLFLDHREARLWTREFVQKKIDEKSSESDKNPRATGDDGAGFSVLNLFAYTGSFSVYAAAGGAEMTHTVDLSKTYCDWARRNFELNEMAKEKHWIYRMDTFEFYKYAARKKLQFDLIILDPPTFSRNKGQNFSVQRDHFDLIEGAAALLKPQGEILFSNNCLDFVLDNRLSKSYKIDNIQNKTVPPDFWVDPKLAGWDFVPQIHNSYLISKNNAGIQ